MTLVLAACSACGANGESIDAGVVDAFVPTSYTAKGIYPGALELAVQEEPDAVVYTIHGDVLDGSSGAADPDDGQSWWRITFVSEATSTGIDVLWWDGAYGVTTREVDLDAVRLISTEWLDSSDAIAKLAENGYEPPPEENQDYLVSMDLAMYAGDSEDFLAIEEPLWRLEKIYAPPGETASGETWLVTYWSAQEGYLICLPDASCALVE